jgi:hypothetical protein
MYAGAYSSEETESKMNILFKDGKLLIEHRNNRTTELTPVYKNGFSYPGGDAYFEVDGAGKVTKLFFSVARARNVEFVRVQ